MRITALFLLISIFQLYANDGYSQQTKLSLDYENVQLVNVLIEIEDNSEFFFLYNEKLVDTERKVTISVRDKKIEEILDILLYGTDVKYSIIDRKIVLAPGFIANEQKGSVSGKVTDVSGQPIPGVSVLIKGTVHGTVTNLNGLYTLTGIDEDAVLQFSFVGMKTQEIPAAGKMSIDVTMAEDAIGIEEVVAIGYGTIRKGEVTSSITSVKEDDFIQGAVTNPLQLVQGKVAGLSISRGSDDPNSSPSILLRGVSSINASMSPLVVIDGIAGGTLNSIPKTDIESIDILKDGSAAAIYGTRGTNGVIIVTTKSGKTGTSQIEYESYASMEVVAKKLDVFTAEEYRNLDQSAIADYGYDTDWVDEMLDPTPISHYHNISLVGGNPKTSYRLSFNYRDIDPIALTNNRSEYGLRGNIKHLAFDDHLSITSNISNQLISGNTVSTGAFEEAITQNPTMPLSDPDNPSEYFRPGGDTFNPVAYIYDNPSEFETDVFMGNVKATLSLFKGFSASALYAVHRVKATSNSYYTIDSYVSESQGYDGQAKKSESHSTEQTFESTINYNLPTTGRHRLSAVAGYSYQGTLAESFYATNYGFLSDGYLWNNLGEGTYLTEGLADMDSEKSESKLISFFGRVNYSFEDKYLVSASLRHEGSTKFGANNKWGTFPAISLGWRISKEPFMSDLGWVDDLKLRAGYGVTGNQGFDAYQSIETYSTTAWAYDVTSGSYVQGYGPTINPNPDLKWEKKHEYNIGIDFSLLKGRLNGALDGYTRLTKDLLYEVNAAQPPNLYDTILDNIGELKNQGLEITLGGAPVSKKDFEWNTSVVWSKFTNEVIKLTQSENDVEYLDLYGLPSPGNLGAAFRLEEGGEVSQFYGYRYAGLDDDGEWLLYASNGEALTKDEISTEDKAYIGNGLPLMNIGWSNTLRYKKWDLAFFFRGEFQYDILNMKDMYYGNKKLLPYNLLTTATGKHKDLDDDPLYSDYYLEKGDYVKLDNLTLGYNLDCSDIKYVNKLRLYMSARNVFVITKYSGLDPELSGEPLTRGADTRTFYPRTRTISFGLNCTF